MSLLLLLLDIALALPVSAHILLTKRDPQSATLWLVAVWLVPALGFLLYWAFGVNRVARRARRRAKGGTGRRTVTDLAVSPSLAGLRRLGDRVGQHPLCADNTIAPLVNGDGTYPAMLAAIRAAERRVHFCSYIFDDDGVGRTFFEELCEAARRGCEVRLLVDGLGAWGLGPDIRRSLTEAGGQVASFWPRGRWLKHPGINLRNHRKILVVDGVTGFTGGINVSSRHVRAAGSAHPASCDLHFRLEGPVVAHLDEAFADDWQLATGTRPTLLRAAATLTTAGTVVARGIACGPDEDIGRVRELLLGAFRTAHESVDLMTPYFIPDRAILDALRTASLAGVRVRLFLPRRTDHRFMLWAARAYIGELLARGVAVYEVGTGFVHSKLAVVDGEWTLFGSSNLDPRSFRLNFEYNVEAWSAPLAAEVTAYIEGFLPGAHAVTGEALRRQHVAVRLRDNAVRLFAPYL